MFQKGSAFVILAGPEGSGIEIHWSRMDQELKWTGKEITGIVIGWNQKGSGIAMNWPRRDQVL